jgi:hypothetical protein
MCSITLAVVDLVAGMDCPQAAWVLPHARPALRRLTGRGRAGHRAPPPLPGLPGLRGTSETATADSPLVRRTCQHRLSASATHRDKSAATDSHRPDHPTPAWDNP